MTTDGGGVVGVCTVGGVTIGGIVPGLYPKGREPEEPPVFLELLGIQSVVTIVAVSPSRILRCFKGSKLETKSERVIIT